MRGADHRRDPRRATRTTASSPRSPGRTPAIAGDAPTSGSGRVWIIDPVDGTINYANGIPFFCVSIGLAVDGRPSVGVVLDPTRDETLRGRVGRAGDAQRRADRGVRRRTSCRTSSSRWRSTGGPSRAGRERSASRSASRARWARRRSAWPTSRNGRFDAFIQQGGLSTWDVAAAGLIAERAGATVTAMDGGPWFDLAHAPKSDRHRRARGAGGTTRRCSRLAAVAERRYSVLEPAMRAATASRVEAPLVAERLPCRARGARPSRARPRRCCADRDAVLGRPQPGEDRGRASPRPSGRGASRPGPARRARLGTSQSPACWRDLLERAVAARAPRRRTSRPSRAGRDSRRTSRRRAPASPGSRLGGTPHFVAHAGVVVDEVAAAIPEHDPLVDDELGHVLVGRADRGSARPRVGGEPAGGGGDRVVGLELDHRPEDDARAPRSAASAIGNWASSSGGIPADDL